MLLNNLCESFNKQLVGARDKSIITCLEYIREYMTMRIVNVKKMQATAMGPLIPQATIAWDEIQTEASKLSVMMVDEVTYQVKSLRSQCVVNVEDRTCTCWRWDLTGMPFKHAVAALYDMIENNMPVGPLEKWVDEAYWLDTWKKIGRPKKSRKKALGEKKKLAASKKRKLKIEEVREAFSVGGRLTKFGQSKSCGRCGGFGHNIRTCKAPSQP
ncbi:uncharacterized protein LOC143602571 [Bidens hawaiensis]|uniref:uncharacterized protein LOC143602571 n=1 Tax=Bidens hawaiensis TaxID=980011 RepID=UPI00404B2E30